MIDFSMLGLGSAAALIANTNIFGVVLSALPLYLIYSTLKVPALQRQTEIDPKTKLFNARYFAEVMRKRHRQVFWQDSCRFANSYYFDKNGDVPLRPATTVEAYWRSRRFDLDDYRFTGLRRDVAKEF